MYSTNPFYSPYELQQQQEEEEQQQQQQQQQQSYHYQQPYQSYESPPYQQAPPQPQQQQQQQPQQQAHRGAAFSHLSEAQQLHILSFCDARELFQCSHTKRSWYLYLEAEEPWLRLSFCNAWRAWRTQYELVQVRSPQRHHPRRRTHQHQQNNNSGGGYRFYGDDSGNDNHHTYKTNEANEDDDADGAAAHTYYLRELPLSAALHQQMEDGDIDDESTQDQNQSYGAYSRPSPPHLRCPIPPPARVASSSREFRWDTMVRRDGGHGGCREFTLRFLQYMKWSLDHSNGARGYARGNDEDEDEASDDDEEEGTGYADAALTAARARAAQCYYCRCLRRREHRHTRGCARSADYRLLCAPSQYVIASPHLRLPPPPARTVEESYSYAAPRSGGGGGIGGPQLWHTVCLPTFKVTGEQRFLMKANKGGGRRYRNPGEAEEDDDGSAGLWLAQQKRVELSFRVLSYCNESTAVAEGEARSGWRQTQRQQRRRCGECVIGFVEQKELSFYLTRRPQQQQQAAGQQQAAKGKASVEVDAEVEAWFNANVSAVMEEQAQEDAKGTQNSHQNRHTYTSDAYTTNSSNPYGAGVDNTFETTNNNDDNNNNNNGGGVYVGDRYNSYGYHCQTGLLYSNGGNSYTLGSTPSGQFTLSPTDNEESGEDIFTLLFLVDEDCIAIAQNGVRIGTVCTDAFSDEQVWIPTVSVKGCGVSLLPPRLV